MAEDDGEWTGNVDDELAKARGKLADANLYAWQHPTEEVGSGDESGRVRQLEEAKRAGCATKLLWGVATILAAFTGIVLIERSGDSGSKTTDATVPATASPTLEVPTPPTTIRDATTSDSEVTETTPVTVAPATVPASVVALDGTYAISSVVLESTVGKGVSCNGGQSQLVATTSGADAGRAVTIVFGSDPQFTEALSADRGFSVSSPVTGASGTSTFNGHFDPAAAPPTFVGESDLDFVGSDGLHQVCRVAYTGQRVA